MRILSILEIIILSFTFISVLFPVQLRYYSVFKVLVNFITGILICNSVVVCIYLQTHTNHDYIIPLLLNIILLSLSVYNTSNMYEICGHKFGFIERVFKWAYIISLTLSISILITVGCYCMIKVMGGL